MSKIKGEGPVPSRRSFGLSLSRTPENWFQALSTVAPAMQATEPSAEAGNFAFAEESPSSSFVDLARFSTLDFRAFWFPFAARGVPASARPVIPHLVHRLGQA
ncbi:hypothetical protein [Actinoplanes sp. NPDC026670]|uniref:hypothetical protein n=1 Tax=Actinoplanes sp. NPDC026670 TaxID=3154700 RepID=UPI0033FFB73C